MQGGETMEYLVNGQNRDSQTICGVEACPINSICGIVACPVNLEPCLANICSMNI